MQSTYIYSQEKVHKFLIQPGKSAQVLDGRLRETGGDILSLKMRGHVRHLRGQQQCKLVHFFLAVYIGTSMQSTYIYSQEKVHKFLIQPGKSAQVLDGRLRETGGDCNRPD